MAPTPVENSLLVDPTSKSNPSSIYWTKTNIATTAVFASLALIILIVLLVFIIRRRIEKRKFVNPTPDKASLLENEDKTNMFSRNQVNSVALYVDSEADAQNKRPSQDAMPLLPLQITPMQEVRNPMRNTDSTGSGISSVSSLSGGTQGTVLLSPISSIGEDRDMSTRGRPRSTSATSVRYYDRTPQTIPPMPIPTIIRTESD